MNRHFEVFTRLPVWLESSAGFLVLMMHFDSKECSNVCEQPVSYIYLYLCTDIDIYSFFDPSILLGVSQLLSLSPKRTLILSR